eukprot:SAG11_NODE_3230_length_2596_cov_1.415298_1_plen_404_part_00
MPCLPPLPCSILVDIYNIALAEIGLLSQERTEVVALVMAQVANGAMSDNRTGEQHVLLRRLYQVFSTTNELGGGAGGAIAGELTKRSMEAIVKELQDRAGFGADSKFLDVGHGTGRPSLHMAVQPGCAVSAGLEYYGDKWQMSITNLHRALATPELESSMSGVRLFHADAESVLTFEPFTHVYVYCTGFPGSLMHNVADSFNKSKSASCIVLFSGKVSNRRSAFFVGGATLITLARYLVAVAVVRALQNLPSAQRASQYGLNAQHVATVKCKMSKGEGGAVSAFVYLKDKEPVGAGAIRQQSQWKRLSDYGQRDDKDCILVKGGENPTSESILESVPIPPHNGDGAFDHASDYRSMPKISGESAELKRWVASQQEHYQCSSKPCATCHRPALSSGTNDGSLYL